MKKMLIAVAGLAAVVGIYSGCETTRGLGEDVENTGYNIQRGVKSVDPNVGNTTDNNQTREQDNETRNQ